MTLVSVLPESEITEPSNWLILAFSGQSNDHFNALWGVKSEICVLLLTCAHSNASLSIANCWRLLGKKFYHSCTIILLITLILWRVHVVYMLVSISPLTIHFNMNAARQGSMRLLADFIIPSHCWPIPQRTSDMLSLTCMKTRTPSTRVLGSRGEITRFDRYQGILPKG